MTKFRAVTLKKAIRLGWQGLQDRREPPFAMTILDQGQEPRLSTRPTNDTPLAFASIPLRGKF
jgi:hypothetical protein